MVKCENKQVSIKGTGLEILAELSAIVVSLRENGASERMINKAVQVGFNTYNEFKDELKTERNN